MATAIAVSGLVKDFGTRTRALDQLDLRGVLGLTLACVLLAAAGALLLRRRNRPPGLRVARQWSSQYGAMWWA